MSIKTSSTHMPGQFQVRAAGMRGLSLIELMIGMALSLVAIVTIYQVLSVWDARRRTITAGSSAQISGSIGISEIERDLQLAGMGFGNVTPPTNSNIGTIGCSVSAYNSTFATPSFNFKFTPVEIVEGTLGAPDTVNVLYGNSAYVVNIQKVNESTDTSKTLPLQYRTGFNAGDLVVVAGVNGPPRDCSLFEITGQSSADTVSIEHGTAIYNSFYGGQPTTPSMNSAVADKSYINGGEIYNLGPGAQRTQWQITIDPTTKASVLTRTNTLRTDPTAPPAEVTEGVVSLKAQYGVDGVQYQLVENPDGSVAANKTTSNLNGRVDDDEWSNVTPTDWSKLLAVRIAVLARSSQLEKDAVTTVAPSWSGGHFFMRNLDGTSAATTVIANDWHHYRYRVYETMVPLRNMLWGAKS